MEELSKAVLLNFFYRHSDNPRPRGLPACRAIGTGRVSSLALQYYGHTFKNSILLATIPSQAQIITGPKLVKGGSDNCSSGLASGSHT